MSYEIKGLIEEIMDEQQITDKFKKREFVIKDATKPEWPELIKFQATQDKCDLLTPLKVGQEVTVFFNLRGRRYEKDGKVNYFTNLEAWRINAEAGSPVKKDTSHTITPQQDDLPF